MGLWKFLQYHNAVPIAFSIALLGAGGVFAATNPEAIYSANAQVIAVDNSYIAYKDLDSYSPTVSITGVTEDDEYYYVAYSFSTIDLLDYVWQDVTKQEVMKVSKADLGPYRDLGLYVTEQLKQKIDREIAYLREVQDIEKKQLSKKMVATAYSGLVGQFLNDTTEVLPNYTPVVVPPAPPEPEPVVAQTGDTPPNQDTPPTQENTVPLVGEPAPQVGPAPVLQILGATPVRVLVGESYTDLGAVITGPTDTERALTIHVFVNGSDVQKVEIDTARAGESTISYQVFHNGTVTAVQRQVIVYEPTPTPEAPIEEPASGAEEVIVPEEIPAETPQETPPQEELAQPVVPEEVTPQAGQ